MYKHYKMDLVSGELFSHMLFLASIHKKKTRKVKRLINTQFSLFIQKYAVSTRYFVKVIIKAFAHKKVRTNFTWLKWLKV